MTMIESVATRQRGAFEFENHYDNLCALQSSCPLPVVKAHLAEGVLDLNGDRIRSVDWVPILNTIRINKTLNFVAVRSYFQQTIEDQEKAGYPVRKKTPAIRCKEITYRLCRGLKECLQVTPTLACLELQGLPLRERDLTALSRGVAKNSTLQHLSLEYSRIGDEGLEILCRGVRNSTSITSINLTGCSLSWRGAEHLAKVIKQQATKRHNEAWQDSLRYRRPDLDRMPGVRRITVNCNPLFGDGGAAALAETLKDDLWLKALDLQQCGISQDGARALLDVLKYNTTIVVLDVRQNPLIEQEMLHNIMEQVMINCNGQDTEYKWVKAEPLQDPMRPKSKKKRAKILQNSFSKKTAAKAANRRRSRSAGSAVNRALQAFNAEDVKPGPGMPWRTALRANRFRGYPPEHSPQKTYENVEDLSASPPSPLGGAPVQPDFSDEETTDSARAYRGSRGVESDDDLSSDRQLKVELEQLRRRYREEKSARTIAEEKVIEMTVENKRLRGEVEEFRVRRSILDDDRVLESIEASFRQFHAFLDLVRDAGLGQLITLAGIDQSQMTIPLTSPQRQSLGGRLSLGSSFIRRRVDSPPPTNAPAAQLPGPSNVLGSRSLASHLDGAAGHTHPELETTRDQLMMGDGGVGAGGDKFSNLMANTTGNTTGVTSEGDISLPPAKGSGILFPHIIPDNYQASSDPTMQSVVAPITISSRKGPSKFDELYQKVLLDTETAISRVNAEASINSSGQSDLNYTSFNGSVNPAQDAMDRLNLGPSREKSRHADHSGALSDASHHSQGSQRSQKSHHSSSRDTVIARDRPVAEKTTPASETLEELGLDPGDMILEHHNDSDSDHSDISDHGDHLVAPDNTLDVPERSPSNQHSDDDDNDEF